MASAAGLRLSTLFNIEGCLLNFNSLSLPTKPRTLRAKARGRRLTKCRCAACWRLSTSHPPFSSFSYLMS